MADAAADSETPWRAVRRAREECNWAQKTIQRVGGRECVKMAIRDCDATFGDVTIVTRSHAISCAVTRCVPPKGLGLL